MVYKKFIKKDGKLYGPYIYESKRVDGKVISEYHGPKRTFNVKRYAWIFASAAFVLFLVYFLSSFNFAGFTGMAILSTDVNYTENQPIKGNVAIQLREGEMLPADSKLILENAEQSYEYNINELVSNQATSGDFYIEGVSLSGTGEGYGIEGEREIYPPVSFVLNIYPVDENASVQPEPIENDAVVVVNESVNADNESANISEPVQPVDTTTNETLDTSVTEPAVLENVNPEATETSPITGFFVRAFNFILGLTPTGNVVLEGNEISGQASFNNPFVYDILGGEAVQLKQGSVNVNGNALSDDVVEISVNGNQIVVETSYSEMEKGYGQEFLGENTETLNLDLSELGLVLNDGELVVKIVSGSQEIISTSIILQNGETASVVETILNETEINVTIEQPRNQTIANETPVFQNDGSVQVITAETVQFILTEEEKTILAEKYGDILETKSERIVNGRLFVKHEIGTDWIENSYDASLPQEEINYQVSVERMKWLKDLAQRIKISETRIQESTVSESFSP